MHASNMVVWMVAAAVSLASFDLAAREDDAPDEESAAPAGDETEADARERLRRLEAKYQKTGDPSYLFERVLTLERLGEYQFALEILNNHRAEFESHAEIDEVAVVEQRLRDRVSVEQDESDRPPTGGSQRADRSGTDLVGWTLTGAGVLAVGGGISQILVAEHRARRLRCSPVSRGPEADGCGGVEPYTGLSRGEFEGKQAAVGRRRWIGVALTGVGTAAAGWGLYRLIRAAGSEASPEAAALPRWTPGWRAGAPTLRLRWRF